MITPTPPAAGEVRIDIWFPMRTTDDVLIRSYKANAAEADKYLALAEEKHAGLRVEIVKTTGTVIGDNVHPLPVDERAWGVARLV